MESRSPRPFATLVLFGLLLGLLSVSIAAAPHAGAQDRWHWPLDPKPEVVRGFEPPATKYAAGHRGADLAGRPGDWVTAVSGGVVRFTGTVAGTPVLSIDHGGIVSTYQPVSATVRTGQRVEAGDPVGNLLVAGSHCPPRACLHLGRKVDDAYADPLALMGSASIRLMTPTGVPPTPPDDIDIIGSGNLSRPSTGPITSPFGMRLHPVTGVFKLHDGTDFGAPCGAPVRAAAEGIVTGTEFHAAYGNRVLVRHGDADGAGLDTTYNHLSAASVRVGQRVKRGQAIGAVGTTGYSTGCHLHFMVLRGGVAEDPMPWL